MKLIFRFWSLLILVFVLGQFFMVFSFVSCEKNTSVAFSSSLVSNQQNGLDRASIENTIQIFRIASNLQALLTNESQYNNLYASLLLGRTEVEKTYLGEELVLIDIELADEVIEGGLDKRSSLDSVQQVVFFAFLTGKKPVVVIYDTDNQVGIYEYQIAKVCEKLKIAYRNVRFLPEREN